MGPRWTKKELEIFLQIFKESALNNIDEIQGRLNEAGYTRSINNLVSLYLKNKNFLKINPNCTADHFEALMTDYYDTIESEIIFANENMNNKNMVMSENNKSYKKQYNSGMEVSQFDESPSQGVLGYASTKKPRSTKKKTNNTEGSYGGEENLLRKIKKLDRDAPNRVKRLRKAQPPKGKPIKTNDIAAGGENTLFAHVEMLTRNCNGKNPKKVIRKPDEPISPNVVRQIEHEYFYSFLDKSYFKINEFKDIIEQFNIDRDNPRLKKWEWHLIRTAIGKPRRFSQNFIKKEKEKLNSYRKTVRGYLANPSGYPLNKEIENPKLLEEIKKMVPLNVSQIVMAVHPNCGHFHFGSILSCNLTTEKIFVKFFSNELGVQRIQDTKLRIEDNLMTQKMSPVQYAPMIFQPTQGNSIPKSPHPTSSSVNNLAASNNEADNPISSKKSKSKDLASPGVGTYPPANAERKMSNQQIVIQDVDFYSTALLIRLLEKKTELINAFRNFNDKAEASSEDLNESFFQEFGWTGVQINLIDNALKHITARFRLRGLNNYNQGLICQNFEKILTSPLKHFLEKELENLSIDSNNYQILSKLKLIIMKNNEERIVSQINDLMEKIEGNRQEASAYNIELNRRDSEGKADPVIKTEEVAGLVAREPERNNEEGPKSRKEHISPENPLNNGPDPSNLVGNQELESFSLDEDICEEKKNSLKELAHNCMGILFSLKNAGEVNIRDNRFIKNIGQTIYDTNENEFHEINNVLLGLSGRKAEV